MKKLKLVWIGWLASCLFGCVASHTPAGKAFTVEFQHTFQGKPFALNTPYITHLGDTVLFTKWKYYVSTNLATSSPQYHLVNVEEDNTAPIRITFVPQPINPPTHLSFGIGIDSLANSQGTQKGVLDPLYGMFWTWEQGYVFLKAEGYYAPHSSKRVSFVLHVGKNQNFQHLAYPIAPNSNMLVVRVKIEKLFGGYPEAGIDLTLPTKPLSIMAGEKMYKLKKNIRAMFD